MTAADRTHQGHWQGTLLGSSADRNGNPGFEFVKQQTEQMRLV